MWPALVIRRGIQEINVLSVQEDFQMLWGSRDTGVACSPTPPAYLFASSSFSLGASPKSSTFRCRGIGWHLLAF